MNDFDLKNEELDQSIVLATPARAGTEKDVFGDLKAQAQEYGQKFTDAATKARDFASEKLEAAGEKFNELKNKEFSELVDEGKEYVRQKPGQALLITAAVGVVLGLILGAGRKR
jgi:ElaB/YqjD/DUF883 family membrane-anchored ribosome-binding protein